jgi:hypothetical protein
MFAIGLRRGLAGLALALTALTVLAPTAPVDARTSLVTESLFVAPKRQFYAPTPYVLVVPSEVSLSQ